MKPTDNNSLILNGLHHRQRLVFPARISRPQLKLHVNPSVANPDTTTTPAPQKPRSIFNLKA